MSETDQETNAKVRRLLEQWKPHGVPVPTGFYWGPSYLAAPRQKYIDKVGEVFPDGEYYVARTDNVLHEKDWLLCKVHVSEGKVRVVENYNLGSAYRITWDHAYEMLLAMCYDPTGQHPETYTEVFRIP